MSELCPSIACRSVAPALIGFLAAAGVAAMSQPARALPHIAGQAAVIDGDTLSIGTAHIRLEGIDAPEMAQTCPRRWLGSWSCGTASAKALRDLIGSRRVDCEERGRDKYGRVLGICFVGTMDINAQMVRSGLAWAFVKYSTTYAADEAQARAEHKGIWQGDAEPAWVYREKRWANAEEAAPNGCAIKGNVSGHGQIYHMPWSPWYGKVKVETAKGERWFCTEAEAKAAGWRPAEVY